MALLRFQLNYHTTWGQLVCLCGSVPELGLLDESNALALSNEGDDWFMEVNVSATADIHYYYFIRQGMNTVRREWGTNRKLHIIKGKRNFLFRISGKINPITRIFIPLFSPRVFFGIKRNPFHQNIILSLWY